MPLQVPSIDDRRYADLVRDTLARVPVHTPEWTNLSESDPGVTLVELFAFLTESLLYRANRVPEVSKAKFLRLLGVPLAAVTPAQGMAVFSGARVDSAAPVLPAGTEVRAGAVPFRTRGAIDVLPIEGRAFVKHRVKLSPTDEAYYQMLYEAVDPGSAMPRLASYETRELDGSRSVALSEETVDGAMWIALLGPAGRKPQEVAQALAGKSLSLGLVPDVDQEPRTLAAVGTSGASFLDGEVSELVRYALPKRSQQSDEAGTSLAAPQARYQTLLPTRADNVLRGPGIVELPLPARAEDIFNWTGLDPLEAGVGDFPPALEDSALAARIVTWVRVAPSRSAGARMRWVGVNATMLDQRVAVANELLGTGDGRPDQLHRLSRQGVVPESVRIEVIESGVTPPRAWQAVDDLMAAGPEVMLNPNQASARPTEVYLVDAEAGTVRFGDGLRGRRPPQGARIVAHYDVCEGRAGNVPAGAISSGPALPPGVRVRNPLPTWGGADAEDATTGERRVASFIRHRDRLVTAEDFKEIAQRAPGVDIARVEVLAAYHPDLGDSQPGDAPGVVTLMLVPRHDPRQPDAPMPDGAFIDAVCRHLDPRRLVTTELVLRGPQYVPLWLSVGITVAGGHTVPEVRDAVKARLRAVLAPTRADGLSDLPGRESGWPLGAAVNPKELWAEAARVPGVLRINGVNLAEGDGTAILDERPLSGLKLPRLLGLSVEVGDPVSIATLRGQGSGDGTGFGSTGGTEEVVVPVPTVPREC